MEQLVAGSLDLDAAGKADQLSTYLRDAARELKQSYKTLILVSPVLRIPPELEKEITVVDFDLPNNAAGGRSKRRMTERVWANFVRS